MDKRSPEEESEWHESDSDRELQLKELTDEDEFNVQNISVGDFVIIKLCGKSETLPNIISQKLLEKPLVG